MTDEQRLEQAIQMDGELQEQWTVRRMIGVRAIIRNSKSIRCCFCGEYVHAGMEYRHTGNRIEERKFAHDECFKAVLARYPVLQAASEDAG